jgi:hypothetical protein
MKPQLFADDIEDVLQPMENDILKIGDFGHVLQGITDGAEIAREYVPGIYRMVVEIIECADLLQQKHKTIQEIATRLRAAA